MTDKHGGERRKALVVAQKTRNGRDGRAIVGKMKIRSTISRDKTETK